MRKTSFKVEDIFGVVISKDVIPTEQITKFKKFQQKNCER